MSFKDYLSDVEKVFHFRIKTLFPLDDASMDLLEKALQKYRPSGISKPKKTMFQTDPLGFTGKKCYEVYMCDVDLTVPVTPTLLQYDLRTILGLGRDDETLKVFGESQDDLETTQEPQETVEKGSLLANENYEEVEEAKFEDFYGDDYNARFRAYLKQVEHERAEKSGRGKKVDAKHPITQWADQPAADGNASPEQPK